MTFDDSDKAFAERVEAALKAASVEGVPLFTSPVMTSAEYAPPIAPDLPRDFNRDIGIAIAAAMRQVPVRLAAYFIADLPPPVVGGIVYTHNGADGAPVVAFSDGYSWLRCDTRLPVG